MGERLKGKVAIVVGAGASSPGIGHGRATAVLFAREGARVMAADCNLKAAEETRRLIKQEGGEGIVFEADVSKSADCKNMVEKCIQAFGRVDILHNNVGISVFGGPVETSEEDWDRVINVNLKGMFLTCKYALPYMEAQGSGCIINISSIVALTVQPVPLVAYSSSKAGVVALTREVAVQYARKGIRANAILPGLMKAAAVQPAALRNLYSAAYKDVSAVAADELEKKRDGLAPLGRQGDPWDTAYAALFLASDESKYITGTTLVLDGGVTAVIRGWEPEKKSVS